MYFWWLSRLYLIFQIIAEDLITTFVVYVKYVNGGWNTIDGDGR